MSHCCKYIINYSKTSMGDTTINNNNNNNNNNNHLYHDYSFDSPKSNRQQKIISPRNNQAEGSLSPRKFFYSTGIMKHESFDKENINYKNCRI